MVWEQATLFRPLEEAAGSEAEEGHCQFLELGCLLQWIVTCLIL